MSTVLLELRSNSLFLLRTYVSMLTASARGCADVNDSDESRSLCAMRGEVSWRSRPNVLKAAAHARQKESHLGTAQACALQGVAFVPMVVETTGHWDVGAARVLRHIANAVAARTGEMAELVHNTMLQELCVVVRSFRARAALRRRCELSEGP